MDNPGNRAAGELGNYARQQRSPGEIVTDIIADAQEIIRSEIRLARIEIKEEFGKALGAGTLLGAGAVMALFAFGFLLWTATYAIGLAVAMWLASLIVAIVLGMAAAILFTAGRSRWKAIQGPRRTVEEMKENAQWLKHPTRS